MKSLDSSTSDDNDRDKPSTPTAERSPLKLRAAQPSHETNGETHVSTVHVIAGSDESPDVESKSHTDSDDSEETTDSESTVSADDDHAADFTTQSQTTSSSPPVM